LVEPNRYWHDLYASLRPGDNFLECAVSPERGEGKMFWFSDLASSNTLSKDFAKRISESQNVPIGNEITVDLITLSDSIDIHRERFSELPTLISIDVEGIDYEIMKAYDFSTRPLFFMIEDPDIDGSFNEGKLRKLLRNVDYRPVSHNLLTTLFVDSTTPESRALLEIGPRNL
jgi:FkbM family methyltransferase